MQTKPTGWERLWALRHDVQYMVTIGGTTGVRRESGVIVEYGVTVGGTQYGQGVLVSLQAGKAVLDKPSVGGTASQQLTVSLRVPSGAVPRMAEVAVRCRLANHDDLTDVSGWLLTGVYFVDTRAYDRDSGVLTLTCYDAMLKTEQDVMDVAAMGTSSDWPMTETEVAEIIAGCMGLVVDPRTELADYDVLYPAEYSLREVLSHIAVANAGNWIVTDYNTLLLIPLAVPMAVLGSEESATGVITANDAMILLPSLNPDGTQRVNLSAEVAELIDGGAMAPYTSVEIWYADDRMQQEPFAPDPGSVMTGFCPYATPAVAQGALEAVDGYRYTAWRATDALLDPCTELGDVVVLDGAANRIYTMIVTMDGLYTADIAAPQNEEIDHEYHFETPTQRELGRRVIIGGNYYGVRISRSQGIVVEHYDAHGDPTGGKVIINTNGMWVTDNASNEKLNFDFSAGEFDFNGNLDATGTITAGTLISPEIYGDYIYADNAFNVRDGRSGSLLGYMGPGSGDEDGTPTTGVIMSVPLGSGQSASSNYVIVTNGGVRMQVGSSTVWVSSAHAHMEAAEHEIDVGVGAQGAGVYVDGELLDVYDILGQLSDLDTRVTDLEDATP